MGKKRLIDVLKNPPNRQPAPGAAWDDSPAPAVVSVVTLRDVQRRMIEESTAAATFESKKKSLEAEVAKLKATLPPPLPDIRKAREDLQASIAVGEATSEDLEKFDAEAEGASTARLTAVRAVQDQVRPLESTIAGLQRRQEGHAREVERLRAEHLELTRGFLMAQAERTGHEYIEALNTAVDAMVRTIAIGGLAKRAGVPNMIGDAWSETILVPLGVESTRGTLPKMDPQTFLPRIQAAEEQFLAELKSAGIPLPLGEDVPTPTSVRSRENEGIAWHPVRPPDTLRGPDGLVLPTHSTSEED